jgi:hypothetical protein
MRDRIASELTLRCHRCSTQDNDKSSKKQGFEWEVGTRSNLLFVGHQCFNECINLSREKQAIVLNIEGRLSLLLRAEWWSNPIETAIILERNKGSSETLKVDRAYLSAMTDASNSMETTINLERNKDLNESLLSDRIYFSGTEWVLYSMWCNERWQWGYINFWFVRLILHCPPAVLFRWNHSISVKLVREGHSLFLAII